ncbi:MAG: transcription-repair coupling factor [Actinomycetota bacterium]|nr:transcription-repair coupling factor [Actinomycetota bacterium]
MPEKDEFIKEIVDRAEARGLAQEISEIFGRPEAPGIFCNRSLLPLLAAIVYRTFGGPLVFATASKAEELASDIELFLPGDTFFIPGAGPGRKIFSPCEDTEGERLRAAKALESGKVAVIGIDALIDRPPPVLPDDWPIVFEIGKEFEIEEIARLLVQAGYTREYEVEGWGRFAIRGGILDIFPTTAERPVRIEFAGERIESMREFNVVTQVSMDSIESVRVYPASEGTCDMRVINLERGFFFLVDKEEIEAVLSEFARDFMGEEERADFGDWGRVIEVETLKAKGYPVLKGEPAKQFRGDISGALNEWRRLVCEGFELFLLLDGEGQILRARELWEQQVEQYPAPRMGVGRLSRGFVLPERRLALYTSSDLLGRSPQKRTVSKPSGGAPVSSYAELEPGCFVVHVDEGIGVFKGLVSREVLGVVREYLLIEYAKEDRLYVPTTQIDRIQRYIGIEKPEVHRLKGTTWGRVKSRARRSAEATARRLLELYADRMSRTGFAFSPDSPWQRELEESFEYEDTPDQARATEQVKSDMESERLMDRLVCGDVGYGKTEVAVRASMKSVLDSKQVAVLVPTTVLANQHLETFRRRLAPFPIRVEMLSRFLSKEAQNKIIRGIRSGEVDIVIGTHRLLQEDVIFKDLGLLVIDEEQKFGVEQKEKLRTLVNKGDTLTMTATPIPRTLQMSLSGIKEISIIDTPPEERRPVATYIGKFDVKVVERALKYELARGGQVFYVHNRVSTIEKTAEFIRGLIPGVPVAIAHGQMEEDELERVMLEFSKGLRRVLVCTSIVESGLDLPNVNTLIVDRAERLGLAQMYQLRGRVGRGPTKAYAYFFYPSRMVLTGEARARLATIAEMTPLGSGIRLALRDLEIRGAGNLLGREQSGHIEAVGFELYCEMLREAVDDLRGQKARRVEEAVIEIPIDAYIPEEYISDEGSRVEQYRRLLIAGRSGKVDDFERELVDRFGGLPVPVLNMLKIERLKVKAGRAAFEAISFRNDELVFKHRHGKSDHCPAAALSAINNGFCEVGDVFIDSRNETLCLKLRLGKVKKRQELLLKWLEIIIDDTIISRVDKFSSVEGLTIAG